MGWPMSGIVKTVRLENGACAADRYVFKIFVAGSAFFGAAMALKNSFVMNE